jgi:hypothetical protein
LAAKLIGLPGNFVEHFVNRDRASGHRVEGRVLFRPAEVAASARGEP